MTENEIALERMRSLLSTEEKNEVILRSHLADLENSVTHTQAALSHSIMRSRAYRETIAGLEEYEANRKTP